MLAEIVIYLFNFCFTNGRFQKFLKKDKNAPLPNLQSTKTTGDFRPVSVTPSLATVFVKLFFKCIMKPNCSNSLNKNQFGLGEMGSTPNALTAIQNYLVDIKYPEYEYRGFISLDFSEVFDRLRHMEITETLRRTKHALKLFVSNVSIMVFYKII